MKNKPEKFNLFHYLSFCLMRLCCVLVNLLPYKTAQKSGHFIGNCLYLIYYPRRKVALENMRNALGGELSDKEITRFVRKSFIHLILIFIEFIRIPKMVKNFSRYVTIDRKEIVWDCLSHGKGVILLISHYGNWELMAVMAGLIGYPICAVGRALKNRYLYNYIEKIRGYTGLVSIPKKGAARDVIKALKNNKVVAILFDQYAGSAGVPVKLFGRTAWTTDAVAQFAARTGAVVVPAYNTRQADGTHRIYVEDPIPTINTGNRKEDIMQNTALYNENLEKWIRKHPEQWLWLHKRWKTPRKYQ
ncbi:lysophospholipid acyltransferase family protein [bacterium]|nr:lysophospholipid acyltransferase family protein [bacterium]